MELTQNLATHQVCPKMLIEHGCNTEEEVKTDLLAVTGSLYISNHPMTNIRWRQWKTLRSAVFSRLWAKVSPIWTLANVLLSSNPIDDDYDEKEKTNVVKSWQMLKISWKSWICVWLSNNALGGDGDGEIRWAVSRKAPIYEMIILRLWCWWRHKLFPYQGPYWPYEGKGRFGSPRGMPTRLCRTHRRAQRLGLWFHWRCHCSDRDHPYQAFRYCPLLAPFLCCNVVFRMHP